MSVSYGFYDSINGDRTYNADQFSSIFDGVFTDGVFPNYADRFAVLANGGMEVTVSAGRAWYDKTWVLNDAPIILGFDTSSLVLNRIDAIVIEVDKRPSVRENSIKVVTGTPASSASRPTLIHEENHNQYPIAYVTIPAGSAEIMQSNIVSVIGTSEAPYASGIINNTSVIIDTVLERFEEEYSNIILDIVYPIGSIYTSVMDTSPETLFGGTWEEISGRFLLGAGTSTDANNETKTFSGGDSNGEYNHVLTTRQLPAHSHSVSLGDAGGHSHTYVDRYRGSGSAGISYGTSVADNVFSNSIIEFTAETSYAGQHTHTVTIGNTGDGEAHNNMPPYLVVYMWKRVA